MKSFARALNALALMHFLAILAFLGFLAGTDRLSMERLRALPAMFAPTISQQKADDEISRAQEKAEQERLAAMIALDEPSNGADDRTLAIRKTRDLISEERRRAEQDIAVLRTKIESDIAALDAQRAAFAAEKAKYDLERQRIESLASDAQFQKVLGTFKALPPVNQKALIEEYLRLGKDEFALDLLDNLDKRTSQILFSLYESGSDLPAAADLLSRLRVRGTAADSASAGETADLQEQ